MNLIILLFYLLFLQNIFVFALSNQNFSIKSNNNDIVNTNLIQTSVQIAQLSYCPYDENNIYTNNIIVYNIEHNGVRAIVGFNSDYNTIFVSYRGSSNIINWINNARLKFTFPFDYNLDAGVETGFYNSYSKVYDDVIESIHYTSDLFGVYDILLTGHSLGAISTILALDLSHYYEQYTIIGLITFGSPRIGNSAFVKAINSLPIEYSYRVVHNDDTVPHLPPIEFNYSHVNTEIWYNENNSEYTICFNPSKCYSSCGNNSCLNNEDHLNYLNVSMGSFGDC